MNRRMVSRTVEMRSLPFQDITQCGDAAMGMSARAARLARFLGLRADMVQKYKWAYGVGIPVRQNAIDGQFADIRPLSFGGKTGFLLHGKSIKKYIPRFYFPSSKTAISIPVATGDPLFGPTPHPVGPIPALGFFHLLRRALT